MERFDFQMDCLFGGLIDPTEYTDRETGEVKLSAQKVQLLRQTDNGRMEPVELKEELFREKTGIDPRELTMGEPVRVAGVYLIRDGFPIFDSVAVLNGASA